MTLNSRFRWRLCSMERIKNLFEEKLAPILRALASCRTADQLNVTRVWGVGVILRLADQIEKNGNIQEKRFAKSYKYYINTQINEKYMEKKSETDVLTVVRKVPPHVSVCRTCLGIGKVYTVQGKRHVLQECPDCCGTGKVKVSSTITTRVQPFIPGKDDVGKPISID